MVGRIRIRKQSLWSIIILLSLCISCQKEKDFWGQLVENGSEDFKTYMSNPDSFELQILYTRLEKDSTGNWSTTQKRFNIDSTKYFYPASTVKMPVAFLALERLKKLRDAGYDIDKETALRVFKSRYAQSPVNSDSTSQSGNASIGHYIYKLFAVSDNDAYNRLYEFLGRDYINQELRKKRIFSNSRIVTRVGVGGFDYDENAYSNAIEFYTGDEVLYKKAAEQSTGNYFAALNGEIKGKGYVKSGEDTPTMEPFDMSKKNFINLIDLQESLQRIIVPKLYAKEQQFDLSKEDYSFLKSALSKLPSSYRYPNYDAKEYYDSYGKFFMYGDSKKPMPAHIKIYNKVGYAYGTLTDCAFIEDEKNDVRFFLSATLLVNENGIFNDDTYEYDDGIAFLAELGRLIYGQEIRNEVDNE